MSPQRSPEEIRASIESNRTELGRAVERLRVELAVATDWRRQLREHQREVLIGAAVAGFVIGGGLAGVVGIFRRRYGGGSGGGAGPPATTTSVRSARR